MDRDILVKMLIAISETQFDHFFKNLNYLKQAEIVDTYGKCFYYNIISADDENMMRKHFKNLTGVI